MNAKQLFSIAFLFFLTPLLFAQAFIKPDTLKKLNNYVFEVVVLKPKEGNLEYVKPVPFERIPFAIRNDKFLPIGTAFLMDDQQFYSASHVFDLYKENVYGNYYIRNTAGTVYKVDKVLSYASDRDFIIFTAEAFPHQKDEGLSAQIDFMLNTQTFSVGNALGEGIVIRDGILTSQTYEAKNGEWKWLRFSAAASPGNSGGPLITAEGEVLGLITMKSANENLNYALPLAETKKTPQNTGSINLSFYYVLPNILEQKFYYEYNHRQNLPKDLTEVRNTLIEDYKTFCSEIVNDCRKEFDFLGSKSFTSANGSIEIMYTGWLPLFPFTIMLAGNRKWDTYRPTNISEYKLSQNGSVQCGRMAGVTMAYILKPSNVCIKELLSSPKLYMDYLLSAAPSYRNVAEENIGISSYGKPVKTDTHIDTYGRTWFVSYWELPFANTEAISFALPIPGGLYMITKTASTDSIRNGHKLDFMFMCDYTIPRYAASFSDWKEFLSLPKDGYAIDPLFDSIKFEYNAGHTLIQGTEFSGNIPKTIFQSDDNTNLRLFLGFNFAAGKLKFELRGFDMYTNSRSDQYRYVSLSKVLNPPGDSPQSMLDDWRQKLDQAVPYNGKPYNSTQYTYCNTILGIEKLSAHEKAFIDSLYYIGVELKETDKFEEAINFSKTLQKTFIIENQAKIAPLP